MRVLKIGAGDRTRTGTLSPAVDFESTTSTIPSHRQLYFQWSSPKGPLRNRRSISEVHQKLLDIQFQKSIAMQSLSLTAAVRDELDFESATSTISSHRQVCYFHFLRFASAGVRLRCPKFYARFRLQNFDRCPSLGSLLPQLAAFPSLPRLSPKRRRRQQILSPLCLPFHHTGRCLTSIVHFGQNCKRKIAAFGSKVNIWP